MADQLVNNAYGNLLPSSQFSITPALLISTFFLAVNRPDVVVNPPTTDNVRTQYDFIVVGAGSAGAVIANRLSENPDFKVLLLEAGGKATETSEIPLFASLGYRSRLDWNYTLVPSSQYCLGMIDQTCYYPRGKSLGGTSTINTLLYVRGNKKDFDDWAAAGNYGWSFEDVLPYFKKSEDNQNKKYARNRRFHSTGGELTVNEISWKTPLADVFIEAAAELGYLPGDFNAENQTAFSATQLTVRDGYRCSTNKAFLVSAGERKNLDIVINAHVTKILIDTSTNRAYGVKYFKNGKFQEVFATKEIILSAGTANTPQLLMLSGIGPKNHLEQLKIPLIKDLPVGYNLQDHAGYGVTFITDKPVTFKGSRYVNLVANMTYDLYQTGPLSSPLAEASGFVYSKFEDRNEEHPDLQLSLLPSPVVSNRNSAISIQHYTDELYKTRYLPIEDKDSFTIILALLRPKSTGRVSLNSKNPFEKPILDTNYFAEEDDVRRLVDGTKFAIKLMETRATEHLNVRYHYVPIPLCPEAVPLSDEYFECLLRYEPLAFLHMTGSAKMGPNNDPTAVVDPQLRVRGISGLRVADASIMPRIVSANTHAATVMIGEKASDLIKNSWKRKRRGILIQK